MSQARCRSLSDIAVSAHEGFFSCHHEVGRASDAVDQAFAAAVDIVELRLGHRIVDIETRSAERAVLLALVKPLYAGRRFFGDAAYLRKGRLVFFVHNLGEVSAVVEQHVGTPCCVGRGDRAIDALPVFLFALPLPCEDGNAGDRDRRRGVVLRREDVARRPAHACAQGDQGFDQHGGLHGHVQTTRDARAFQRTRRGVFFAQSHEPWHFAFGKGDLAPSPLGKRDVSDLKVVARSAIGVVGVCENFGGGRGHAVRSMCYARLKDERCFAHYKACGGGKQQERRVFCTREIF